jgi:rod shape-determining protein MreD
MIYQLASIPIMLLLSVLQMAAVSRINLLGGAADLILLAVAAWGVHEKARDVYLWAIVGGFFITIVSGMPLLTPIVPYLFTAFLSRILQVRLWQSPLISLIIVVIVGTVFQHIFSILVIQLSGVDIGWVESLSNVTMPSILLNFIFLFPVYSLMSDAARWLLREESDA